jgi:hypothetical protein
MIVPDLDIAGGARLGIPTVAFSRIGPSPRRLKE